jgi:hypothetical protein
MCSTFKDIPGRLLIVEVLLAQVAPLPLLALLVAEVQLLERLVLGYNQNTKQ